jgi:hypothetical protein
MCKPAALPAACGAGPTPGAGRIAPKPAAPPRPAPLSPWQPTRPRAAAQSGPCAALQQREQRHQLLRAKLAFILSRVATVFNGTVTNVCFAQVRSPPPPRELTLPMACRVGSRRATPRLPRLLLCPSVSACSLSASTIGPMCLQPALLSPPSSATAPHPAGLVPHLAGSRHRARQLRRGRGRARRHLRLAAAR